jgi:ketosteroid isomerase-like protein
MPNDVAKIRGVLRQEVSAVNAGDLEAWKKNLTSDIAFMAPDAPRAKGMRAVCAFARSAFFDPFNMKLQMKFNDVNVFGPQAWATGAFHLELTPKAGGNPARSVGKFVRSFRKQKNGSWKQSLVIFNFDKPPA